MLEEVRKKCEGRICKLEESTVKRTNTIYFWRFVDRDTIYFTNHSKNIMLQQNTFIHPKPAVPTWENTELRWRLICNMVLLRTADRYKPFLRNMVPPSSEYSLLLQSGSTFLPNLHGVTFPKENKLQTRNTDVTKWGCFSLRTFLFSTTKQRL